MNLGIDLGTSNSAVAGVVGSRTDIYKTAEGSEYLPSVIYIDRRGNRLYGQRAYNQCFLSPDNVASGFKRLMGTNSEFRFAASGETLAPEDCSADIIKQLVGQACTETGQSGILGTVVTIPAAFNQMQSEATLAAAQKAGLEHVALLQEPIAAAMAALAHSKGRNGQFLVYDLGGGTFDLALVQGINGSVNVLAHEGINMLGGRDFDKAILNSVVRPWLLDNFRLADDFQKGSDGQRLMRLATFAVEKAKIALTTAETTVIAASEEEVRVNDLNGDEIYLQINLSRREVEELIDEPISMTIELSRKVMKDNGYSHDDIDRIVFIGGPTKMPGIRDRVPRELGIPADLQTNPMTAVAFGAAIYCESRNWEKGGSSRKSGVGRIKTSGSLQLHLDFASRTSDETGKIKVGMETKAVQGDYEIEFITRDGWTSGRMALLPGISVEVPLGDFGDNVIRIAVYDKSGRPVADACQEIVVTRVYATAAGIPATQTISVKVVESAGGSRNTLEPLVKKGTILPASGTKSFRAARALKAGDHDYLELSLFQDQGVPEVDLNLCVGSFRVSGTDLSEGMTIRVGDVVNVKWFLSDSGLLSAGIELPSIGQTFSTPKFYSPQSGHQSFSLEPGTQLSQEVITKANEELDETEEALGETAAELVERLRFELERQKELLNNATCGEDTRSVTEAVRQIRQEVSRLKHAPAHKSQVYAQQLVRLQADFNQHIRPYIDGRLTQLFDQHSMNAQKALAKGDERSIREVEAHIEAMEVIQMRHLLQDPRFLIAVLRDRSTRRSLSSDSAEFDRLIRQGEKAIEMEDIDALREAIIRIDDNLVTAVSLDSDVTKLASLMRA